MPASLLPAPHGSASGKQPFLWTMLYAPPLSIFVDAPTSLTAPPSLNGQSGALIVVSRRSSSVLLSPAPSLTFIFCSTMPTTATTPLKRCSRHGGERYLSLSHLVIHRRAHPRRKALCQYNMLYRMVIPPFLFFLIWLNL